MVKGLCIILVLFLSLLTVECAAQESRWVISVLPSTLIEPMDAGITLGADYKISEKLALRMDAGAIFFDLSERRSNNGSRDGVGGFKIKPALRIYGNQKKTQRGFYIEIEALLKHVNYYRNSGVNLQDANGNFAYRFLGTYNEIKNVYGGSFIIGSRGFNKKYPRLGTDVYLGAGVKQKDFHLKAKDLPAGLFLPSAGQRVENFATDGPVVNLFLDGPTLNLPCGVRFLYKL